MLALAAPLASAAPLRFSYNFLLPPHSPVIPAHLKFPYRFCPPTRPAPASAQPSFCAGFAAQKLLIRFQPSTLDVLADGRSEGEAHQGGAPLDAGGDARGSRVNHPGGNSPRNLAPEASELAGLAQVVAGRLTGRMATALLRVCV